MRFHTLPKRIKDDVLRLQKTKLLAFKVGLIVAHKLDNVRNEDIVRQLAFEEWKGYRTWRKVSGQEIKLKRAQVLLFVFLYNLLGLTFIIKLFERLVRNTERNFDYEFLEIVFPNEVIAIQELDPFEDRLIRSIDEKRVRLMGSVTLGLNDALVELTGALAGFTLAIQNTQIIGPTALIMGLTASLSMAGSEYLSIRTDGGERPFQAAYFTGFSYVIAVLLLVTPFFVFSEAIVAIGATIVMAILIILFFTYYLSIIKGHNFLNRFVEMTAISLGVAIISFGIGFAVKNVFGLDI